MKLPEGVSTGFLFNIASGKQVDLYGEWNGLTRKRWWIFRETDAAFKKRIVAKVLAEKEKAPN